MPTRHSKSNTAASPSFDEAFISIEPAADRLRAALRAALDAVLPDSAGARACGRALGVSAHTGWRCWSIARSSDTASLLRALPGGHGWALVLKALERRRCPEAAITALRGAIASMASTIADSGVDATMLRSLAAGGLDSNRERETILRARRAARRANEITFGVRAEAILAAFMIGSPNRRHLVASTSLLLYQSLSRLRPGPDWPIHRGSIFYEARRPAQRSSAGDLPCFRSLCADLSSPGIAGFELLERIEQRSGSRTIDLGMIAPNRGREGVHAAFLDHTPRAGSVRTADGRAELRTSVLMPTPRLLFEVLLHRDVPRDGEMAAAMYGIPEAFGIEPTLLDAGRLPLAESVEQPRSGRLPAALRSAEATWRRLIERGAESLRAPLEDFHRFRLLVPDPPLHAVVTMRWSMRPPAP